ncbi:endo alpha-1,4 polygalactosaminidase [Microbacterium gilvum]|uniref:Endo alpha-1,4 polygalactosaminidase n=1 Tax=Microbacterium gilvum TaxID=1336204 RepID=A0ABP8ZZU8_9MICO
MAAGALAALLALSGCAAEADGADRDASVVLPPADGVIDYQLGGVYEPGDEVTIVARDRTEEPAPDVYGICYVNLFQTQPDADSIPDPDAEGTTAWWEAAHPELLLRDADGALVVDGEWDEALFDIRTEDKRDALIAIQSEWIRGCADDGFDAVEFDNLDQSTRSQGLQTLDDAISHVRPAISLAHDVGLAAGQKNTAELGDAGPVLVSTDEGFDFAIAEECEVYDECGDYPYPGRVLEIEYTDTGELTRDGDTRTAFEWACERHAGEHPITLRDRDLVAPDDPAYTFAHC